MLKQNDRKRETCGVDRWHKKDCKGQGITVAVLDAMPYIAPDMDKNIFSAPLGEGIGRTHATNVAAVIHEAAPEAKIVMLPFMDNQRLDSLRWLRENPVDLINISLKLSTSDGKEDSQVMQELKALNIPIIAAAGNDGEDAKDCAAPARYDWTIAVGGFVENSLQVYYENSVGNSMDCVAYTYIDIEMKPGYVVPFPGTSAAAPWLCGMLACWFTRQKIPIVEKLLPLITDNCVDVGDEGKDCQSGYGLFVLPDTPPVTTEDAPTSDKGTTEIILKLDSNIAIVNGKEVQMDCVPFAENGRTFVPIRFVAESLGCTVDYDKGKITIRI